MVLRDVTKEAELEKVGMVQIRLTNCPQAKPVSS
jgi:hypothetical protein